MPTIDDLTISLTIKDNSNLDKLRKNLDTVIKSGGLQPGGIAGAGFGAGGKDIEKIKKSLVGITQQMDFLLPTVSPRAGDITGIKEYGRRVSANIETFKTEIASFVTPDKLNSLQDLAKDLNIQDLTVENMQYGLEDLMDKYNIIAQSIAKGELIMRGAKAKKWLDVVAGVIKNIQGTGGLTSLRDIEKNLPESIIQKTLEALMKKAGIVKEGQFKMYEVGTGRYKKGDEEKMKEWLGKEDEELMKKYGDMFKDKSMWTGLMYAMKDLGYEPEDLQKILTMVNEVKDNTDVENLVKTMFHLSQKNVIEDFWLPASLRDLVLEKTGVQVREKGEHTMTALDINVMGGNIDKLVEIIPTLSDITVKLAEELGVIPLELKTWLEAGKTGNIPLQARIYGSENLKVVASMISDNVRATLDKLGVEYFTVPFLKDAMIEAGLTTQAQSQEDLKSAMGELAKDLNLEEIQRIVEKIDSKVATATSLEELKIIFEKVDFLLQNIEKLYSGF